MKERKTAVLQELKGNSSQHTLNLVADLIDVYIEQYREDLENAEDNGYLQAQGSIKGLRKLRNQIAPSKK